MHPSLILLKKTQDTLANFIRLLNELPPVLDRRIVENLGQAERQKIYNALCASLPRLRALYHAIISIENRAGLQEGSADVANQNINGYNTASRREFPRS